VIIEREIPHYEVPNRTSFLWSTLWLTCEPQPRATMSKAARKGAKQLMKAVRKSNASLMIASGMVAGRMALKPRHERKYAMAARFFDDNRLRRFLPPRMKEWVDVSDIFKFCLASAVFPFPCEIHAGTAFMYATVKDHYSKCGACPAPILSVSLHNGGLLCFYGTEQAVGRLGRTPVWILFDGAGAATKLGDTTISTPAELQSSAAAVYAHVHRIDIAVLMAMLNEICVRLPETEFPTHADVFNFGDNADLYLPPFVGATSDEIKERYDVDKQIINRKLRAFNAYLDTLSLD
jgi:hypothetical protein